MSWVDVAGGRIAVGPRPTIKALVDMRASGATHIVTLLSEGEGAREVGDAAAAAGPHRLAWGHRFAR